MIRFKALSIFGVVLSLILLAPLPANAQRGGRMGGGIRGGGFRGGFSSGAVGSLRGGFGNPGGHAGFSRVFPSGRSFGNRSFFYPRQRYYYHPYYGFYGFPSFGFYTNFGYDYWPYDWYSPAYAYYPSYTPTVIYLSPPRTADNQVEQPPAQQQQQAAAERYWLVVLKDNTIISITDYWLEGSVFHYVTRQGKESSIDYSQVDLDFTRRLNKERGVEFQSPRIKSSYQPMRYDAFGRPYAVAIGRTSTSAIAAVRPKP